MRCTKSIKQKPGKMKLWNPFGHYIIFFSQCRGLPIFFFHFCQKQFWKTTLKRQSQRKLQYYYYYFLIHGNLQSKALFFLHINLQRISLLFIFIRSLSICKLIDFRMVSTFNFILCILMTLFVHKFCFVTFRFFASFFLFFLSLTMTLIGKPN